MSAYFAMDALTIENVMHHAKVVDILKKTHNHGSDFIAMVMIWAHMSQWLKIQFLFRLFPEEILNSNADLSLSDDSDFYTPSSSLQPCRMSYRKIGDDLKEAALLLDAHGCDNVYDIAAITGFSICTFYRV